jgi:hypothetical protein
VPSNSVHEAIFLEWAHPPYPTQVRLTNKTPSALIDVDASIVDIKRKQDGMFVHTLDWLPPRGPFELPKELPAIVLHNQSLLFEVLRGDVVDPHVWHVGVRDMTISSGEWEFTIKCTWSGQAEPLVKKFRFHFQQAGRPRILP